MPQTQDLPGSSPPLFVVTSARSGSTLLRWLIDSHPDVACPSETDVAGLAHAYLAASRRLGDVEGEDTSFRDARDVVQRLMGPYLRAKGKSRWCDKSLATADHADLVAAVWPEARFVFLYRHAMDVVASALDAQPWGLNEYGFAEFSRRYPTDSVAALVAYWHDRTSRMLDAESRLGDRVVRLRYEDLVADPRASLARVWTALDVPPIDADDAFSQEHDAFGPADYKIWQTSGVHQESVGRGAHVPPGRVAKPARVAMNRLLLELGYQVVDDHWGCGGAPPAPTSIHPSHVELRVVEGHRRLWRSVLDLAAGVSLDPSTVDPPGMVIAVERSALRDLLADTSSLPSEVRRGHVRWYGPTFTSYAAERAFFSGLAAFLSAHGPLLLDQTALVPEGPR